MEPATAAAAVASGWMELSKETEATVAAPGTVAGGASPDLPDLIAAGKISPLPVEF